MSITNEQVISNKQVISAAIGMWRCGADLNEISDAVGLPLYVVNCWIAFYMETQPKKPYKILEEKSNSDVSV